MSMLASRSGTAVAVAALGAWLVAARVAEARVTSITITSTTLAFGGRMFGTAGAYEQIRGTASGELDPSDPLNAVITHINLPTPNANSKMAYTTTFTLHNPVDMSSATAALVYPANNPHTH